jgi:hypothetical protein
MEGNNAGMVTAMPYYHFSESWTPLRLIGIRFFTDDEGRRWIKVWGFHRRRI